MRRRVLQFFKGCLLTGMPLLTIGLFVPISIYAGNQNEFSTGLASILLFLLPWLVLLAASGGLLSSAMPTNAFRRLSAVLSAVVILTWFQANILIWDYGVFDGSSIAWLDHPLRGALDLLLWIALLTVAAIAWRRLEKPLFWAAAASIVVQSVSLLPQLGHVSSPEQVTADAAPALAARASIFEFSKQKNVIQIVMDGFQRDIFDEIVDDPQNSEIREALRGFTSFDNHLGAYPYTQMTLPAYLSGELYRNHMPAQEFVSKTVSGRTILRSALDAGFDVDIAAPVALANVYRLGAHTHLHAIRRNDHVTQGDYVASEALLLLDVALFRSVPHFAKALVHRDELWLFRGMAHSSSYLQLQYFSDILFLQNLAQKLQVTREKPVYKLVHVMLSHRPTVGTRNCQYDGRQPTQRPYVIAQSTCGLSRVAALLRQMQARGIYDDAVIVLMSDHGAWVPYSDYTEGLSGPNPISAVSMGMASPVLAVKPANAHHGMRRTLAPTSMIDVPNTVAEAIGIEPSFKGVSALSLDADATRIREHLIYGYGINPDNKDYLFPMRQFLVKPDYANTDSWNEVQRFAAP